jgi:4-aminobutyrate aminotransferase/(S)-3-amino-2-methylpropionate transaminase
VTGAPTSRSQALGERLARVECPAFAHRRRLRAGDDAAPIVLASGHGSILLDVDGRRYLDLAAGFGAVLLGHGHPAVRRALEEQGSRLVQGLGDVHATDAKVELLETLAALHPDPRAKVLLAQSGADAVTAAIKTASLATGRDGLLAFEGAYHGLGYAPLAACGFRASFRAPFAAQLSAHVRFAPFPGLGGAGLDEALAAVERHLASGAIAAVLVEPVLGRGGCVVPPDSFLRDLCALAHREGALVVADEIWTGLGRTGSMARSLAVEAPVDLVCLGKGLGGGLPISACIGSDEAMQGWTRAGEVIHTSTHAGAPLACAAARAVIETVRAEGLAARAVELGARLCRRLEDALDGSAKLRAVRGAGLLVGIELDAPATAARALARLATRGYLAVSGGVLGDVVTLSPALTIEEAPLLAFADALRAVLDAVIDEG